MTFYESIRAFPKISETPVCDHSNYRLFERIPAVPGTSNNRGLTVGILQVLRLEFFLKVKDFGNFELSPMTLFAKTKMTSIEKIQYF